MDIRSFAKDVKTVPILTYASGTANRNSEVIDCLGVGKVTIHLVHAAIATNAVSNFFLKHADAASDENTLTSGANVATSNQSVADTDDNTVKYMEFIPSKRYYQLQFNKDGSNAQGELAIAHLYLGQTQPVVAASGNTVIGEGHAAVTGEIIGLAVTGTI